MVESLERDNKKEGKERKKKDLLWDIAVYFTFTFLKISSP